MKKVSLIATLAVMMTVAFGLTAPALADPIIDVDPLEHDFGNVEVNTSATTIITVAAETLDGRGPRDRAKRARLKVFRFILVAAGTLIEGDYMGWACFTLERAWLRSDGLTRPPDFVIGEARAELNDMILQLMADLGCE